MTVSMSSSNVVGQPQASGDQHYSEQIEKREVIDKIFNKINERMKGSGDPSKAFICDKDIESAWSDESIATILHLEQYSSAKFQAIRANFIKILSILVYTGAHSGLLDFHSFFNHNTPIPTLRDSDLPFYKHQLDFLEEAASRHSFYKEQFRFIPEVIRVSSTQETLVLDERRPLPFETVEKKVCIGGYGTVTRVSISAGYLKQEDGTIWPEAKIVACKKLEVSQDFKTEIKNLKILKESLTEHRNIMKHLATITHGSKHYILLPLTDHLDLELFLHCGTSDDGKRLYNFEDRFPAPKGGDLTTALFHQLYLVAHALAWLHSGISMEQSHSRIFCAHMDLKPSNILVENAKDSPVGRWMLSDFGISVFKEDTQKQDSKYVSIGDYYSQITTKTRLRRAKGTYQAPEVTIRKPSWDQLSHLSPDQKEIARKSDVWSFGCIFSDVLAFELGRDKLVKEFQIVRKGNLSDDYFYLDKTAGSPSAPDSPEQYQVRPWIVEWLQRLPRRFDRPAEWLGCCAATILDILIIDAERRPDANRVLEMTSHIYTHLVASRRDSKITDCPFKKNEDLEGSITSSLPKWLQEPQMQSCVPEKLEKPVAHSTRIYSNVPWIDDPPLSTPTAGTESVSLLTSMKPPTVDSTPIVIVPALTFGGDSRNQNGDPPQSLPKIDLHFSPSALHSPPWSPSLGQDSIYELPSYDMSWNPPRPQPFSAPQASYIQINSEASTPSIADENPEKSFLYGSVPEEPHRVRPFSEVPNSATGHGIVIRNDISRKPLPSIIISLKTQTTKKKKKVVNAFLRSTGIITDVSLACDGKLVAYLIGSRIHVFSIKLEEKSYVELPNLSLPEGKSWQAVTAEGYYIVAWGQSLARGRHMVYLRDMRDAEGTLEPPGPEQLVSLKNIALSQHGAAAFVCNDTILFTTLWSRSLGSRKYEIVLSAEHGQAFTHAAFNDAGTLLYAWAHSQGLGHLYTWQTQSGAISPRPISVGRYSSYEQASISCIIPYNEFPGCIIKKPQNQFFPSQTHNSKSSGVGTLPRHEVALPHVLTTCMFLDHSLLTIEKEAMRRARVKEHLIWYGSDHTLEKEGEEVCKLTTGSKDGSRMRVVRIGQDVFIVVANLDGILEIIIMQAA